MIRVKAAFFSLTPPAPPDDEGSSLRWHLLEQGVDGETHRARLLQGVALRDISSTLGGP